MSAAGLGQSSLPETVMAARCGLVALFLACALSSRLLLRAESDYWGAPCEEQQRYQQNHAEPEVVWGSTMAILGIFGALMVLVQYVINFINKDQCPQERKECEMQREDCPESCRKTSKGRSASCSSQTLVSSPARSEPCHSVCNQTQQAYAQQLACMEEQLEALLYEVRGQRSTLKDTLTEKESLLNTTEKGSDKLRITVYEIADCEGSNNVQPRGRRRQF
ncbi:uncharacterized protein LOC143832711 [Paroedura picta]|uniref:uncharacterized protein LOC143832711 n=1 Tax=Paroedura picta TaxID=143630 RepID=UPI0040562BAE